MALRACSRWMELIEHNERHESYRAEHKPPIQPDTTMKRFIILIIALAQSALGENVTLVVESQAFSQTVYSQSITLNQGDSARLLFADGGVSGATLECSIDSKSFELPLLVRVAAGTNSQDILGINPVVIAGPATIVMKAGGQFNGAGKRFATFEVTRTGIASPPAEIPQEVDTTWNVILESSSDLINWTLANPGIYSGTEPKRFFRTRMVKQP